MRTIQRLSTACALALAGAALACGGGGGTPTTPTTNTTTTPTTVLTKKIEYAGSLATKDVKITGKIVVSATVPAGGTTSSTTGSSPKADAEVYPCTGTLTLASGAVINLAGYYDTAAKRVFLSGGGYLITWTADSFYASLDGKATMPDGTIGEAYAYQRTSTTAPQLYCGTFTKSAGGGGWFTLTAFDGQMAGIGSDGTGTVALSGTLSNGGTANFTWVPEPGDFGRALGTLTGTTMNGTWTLTGIDNEKGNWNATLNACR